MTDLERTYTPAEAAERYGFAPSLLRRYAGIYESLGGTIATDKRGGRIYSAELLGHFSAARERVQAGEKVEDALKTLELAPLSHVQDTHEDVSAQQMLTLLERVLSTNEKLQQEVSALQDQVSELAQRQLNEELQQEISALRDQVAKLTQRQLEAPREHDETETARMNRYLLGELERRRLEAEQQKQRRPWWQIWGRR